MDLDAISSSLNTDLHQRFNQSESQSIDIKRFQVHSCLLVYLRADDVSKKGVFITTCEDTTGGRASTTSMWVIDFLFKCSLMMSSFDLRWKDGQLTTKKYEKILFTIIKCVMMRI